MCSLKSLCHLCVCVHSWFISKVDHHLSARLAFFFMKTHTESNICVCMCTCVFVVCVLRCFCAAFVGHMNRPWSVYVCVCVQVHLRYFCGLNAMTDAQGKTLQAKIKCVCVCVCVSRCTCAIFVDQTPWRQMRKPCRLKKKCVCMCVCPGAPALFLWTKRHEDRCASPAG